MMEPVWRSLDVEGLETWYQVAGKEGGAPLIFIHSLRPLLPNTVSRLWTCPGTGAARNRTIASIPWIFLPEPCMRLLKGNTLSVPC